MDDHVTVTQTEDGSITVGYPSTGAGTTVVVFSGDNVSLHLGGDESTGSIG